MPTDPETAAQTAAKPAGQAAAQDAQDGADGTDGPAPAPAQHSLAALRLRYGPNHRWWVLLTVMIGNMAALMAATTINVAVPAISRQFQLGQQDAQWLATSFMGAMTV